MRIRTCVLAALGALALGTAAQQLSAQEHAIGGLRIADATGAAIGALPAPTGEKYFHLDAGTKQYYIAFDFSGTSPTDVQLRVLGPMGTVLFQDTKTYSKPGVQIVPVESAVPLEDNEYVVNAYIGPEWYLADSLQLAVGQAQIPGSQEEATGSPAPPAQATMAPLTPESTPGQSLVPGGPPKGVLIAAGVLLLALVGVVVWATISAMRSR